MITINGLKFYIESNGYYRHKGKKSIYLHQMLAEKYLGKCPKGYIVNHKDGNKLNNEANNLEYVTHKENMQHAFDIGLINNSGSCNGRSKLTEKDVIEIKKLFSSLTDSEIANKFNVARSTINLIRNRRTWKHV